jgi:hypothetical protein
MCVYDFLRTNVNFYVNCFAERNSRSRRVPLWCHGQGSGRQTVSGSLAGQSAGVGHNGCPARYVTDSLIVWQYNLLIHWLLSIRLIAWLSKWLICRSDFQYIDWLAGCPNNWWLADWMTGRLLSYCLVCWLWNWLIIPPDSKLISWLLAN